MTTALTITIDNQFRLVTDRTGWEVQQFREAQKGPKQGELGWYSEGHYDTLPWALRGVYRLMLHTGHGEADLAALAERIEVSEQRIVLAVDRDYLARVPAVPAREEPRSVWEQIRPGSQTRMKAGGER